MTNLSNKVAVITGSANGIGFAIAEALLEHGCKLVIADVKTGALSAAAERLRERGADVVAVPTDVSSAADIDRLVGLTEDRFGGVQLVFANAGVSLVGRSSGTLSMNDWQWVMGVNLLGIVNTAQAFMPLLEREEQSHLVLTASGVCSFVGMALNGPYCASKAAVLLFGETLYREHAMARSPVGISVLLPGAVSTTLHRSESRRPAALPDLAEYDPVPAEFRESRKRDGGPRMSASEAARITVNGVMENRFYIVTHPEAGDLFEMRGHDARVGRNPEFP